MSCENYKDALTEAAATNAAPTAELRAHLETCVACHAQFTETQTLFAAIDARLCTIANAQPSPSFLPRVRNSIEQIAAPKSNWTPVWLAAATAASFLILLSFPLLHRDKMPQPQLQTLQISKVQQSQSSKPIELQSESHAPKPAFVANISHPHPPQHNVLKSVRKNIQQQPEVLVPAEERESFARFVSELQRPEVVSALASGPAKKEEKLLQLDPVQVARLSIAPLEGSAD